MDDDRLTAVPAVIHEGELEFNPATRIFSGWLKSLRTPALPAVVILVTRHGTELYFGFMGRTIRKKQLLNWIWEEPNGTGFSLVIANQ